jgi:hypothetical protein
MRIIPPQRISQVYVQHLVAPPERVFPLLCPVREREWVRGWDPDLVVTASGVAEPECVFTVGAAVWVVTDFQPPARIEFLKVTPGETAGRIRIELAPEGTGGSVATVRYTYTALGEGGEQTLAEFTAVAYEGFMREWERELNHFLQTGHKLAESSVAAAERAEVAP